MFRPFFGVITDIETSKFIILLFLFFLVFIHIFSPFPTFFRVNKILLTILFHHFCYLFSYAWLYFFWWLPYVWLIIVCIILMLLPLPEQCKNLKTFQLHLLPFYSLRYSYIFGDYKCHNIVALLGVLFCFLYSFSFLCSFFFLIVLCFHFDLFSFTVKNFL